MNTLNKNIRDASFISVVITHWHLDNLIAYLKLNNLSSGLIYVLPQLIQDDKPIYRLTIEQVEQYNKGFFSDIIIMNTPVFPLKSWSMLKYLFTKKKEELKVISPGGANFRLLSNLCNQNRKHTCVIIDEGLGAYLPQKDFEKIKTKSPEEPTNTFKIFPGIKKFIANSYIHKTIDSRLFRENEKLIPNSAVTKALDEHFKSLVKTNKLSRSIILFKDYEVIDFKNIEPFYRYLLNILKENNYRVLIKKHPNDKDKNFDNLIQSYDNTELIEGLISGELLVAKHQPDFIMGGFTTALFSSSALFGINTISFMLLYKNYEGISQDRIRIIDWFYSKFEGSIKNVNFITRKQELRTIFEEKGNEG